MSSSTRIANWLTLSGLTPPSVESKTSRWVRSQVWVMPSRCAYKKEWCSSSLLLSKRLASLPKTNSCRLRRDSRIALIALSTKTERLPSKTKAASTLEKDAWPELTTSLSMEEASLEQTMPSNWTPTKQDFKSKSCLSKKTYATSLVTLLNRVQDPLQEIARSQPS